MDAGLLESTAALLEAADGDLSVEERDYTGLRGRVERMSYLFIASMFPRHAEGLTDRRAVLREAGELLLECLRGVLPPDRSPEDTAEATFRALPEVRRQLGTDVRAAYAGDPAARSLDEVILCYPAFTAISTYRLAHVLYEQQVPLIPRVMTEFAHRLTGIDIHPGAVIGDSFFIDHGTGVVIGETTTIGKNVKLYQHVTLGAKSFEAAPDGSLVKGIKRHPDIGDRVVIYAGATVLGGGTRIGNDCVIGGSVWLTHSVEAGKMVMARAAVTNDHLTREVMGQPAMDSAML